MKAGPVDDEAAWRPLRILQVAPYYEDAWAYGGIPRVVSRLARGLAARGHHVTVCTTDVCDAERRLPKGGGQGPVEVAAFPNVSNALAYHLQFFLPMGLGSYLRERAASFDIAHLHACHNVPGAIAARHLGAAGVPYLLQPHGTAPLIERRRAIKWIFDRTIGRRVMPGAARLLAVSRAEQRQLASLGVTDHRIDLLLNPLDLEEHDRGVAAGRFRRRWGVGAEPLILYLGKLTPRKCVDVLIRAFSVATSEARLVIAGNDMGVRADLERVARGLGVAARTIFTGLLQGVERLEALADADALVYPGAHEIFGLVPLEALLAGTPAIVANDSGCGEIVREIGGGLVVPLGDVAGFAEAVRTVLGARSRWRGEARQAGRRARLRFAPDLVCARLESIYRSVLASRRAPISIDRRGSLPRPVAAPQVIPNALRESREAGHQHR